MGANQTAQKLLSTDLVNTKKSYALKLEKKCDYNLYFPKY